MWLSCQYICWIDAWMAWRTMVTLCVQFISVLWAVHIYLCNSASLETLISLYIYVCVLAISKAYNFIAMWCSLCAHFSKFSFKVIMQMSIYIYGGNVNWYAWLCRGVYVGNNLIYMVMICCWEEYYIVAPTSKSVLIVIVMCKRVYFDYIFCCTTWSVCKIKVSHIYIL